MKAIFFLGLCALPIAARCQDVVAVEYFLDTDAGFGLNTVVPVATPASDGSFLITVSLTGVVPGPHILYTRTRSSAGTWSHTAWRAIDVLRSDNPLVASAEYFFGTDPGFGAGTPVSFPTPAADGNFPVVVPPAQATPGPVRIYLRTKDSDGIWSHTTYKDITIVIGTNGVSAVAGAEFSLYPNPASDRIMIRFLGAPKTTVRAALLDVAGKIVASASGADAALDMALPALPAGSYLLRLEAGGGAATRTVTVLQ